jgi:hypothetical protein
MELPLRRVIPRRHVDCRRQAITALTSASGWTGFRSTNVKSLSLMRVSVPRHDNNRDATGLGMSAELALDVLTFKTW